MITGRTRLIAHLGYPTEGFKAPMIYNPWFERAGVEAVVVPMGVRAPDFECTLHTLARVTNFHGALVTMPHKRAALALVDEASGTARIAGACNAILRREDGGLVGDMFDGAGFVRGAQGKGVRVRGARALVVGTGGVGSAIAASLAAAGVGVLGLFDVDRTAAEALAARIGRHHPSVEVEIRTNDPDGFDIVVNATPLGMRAEDPLPFDPSRVAPGALVGEVVLSTEITPVLRVARERGCVIQVGTDMLFEMIPAYLEFFGFGSASVDELRAVAAVG